jgi:hypothetical protein
MYKASAMTDGTKIVINGTNISPINGAAIKFIIKYDNPMAKSLT